MTFKGSVEEEKKKINILIKVCFGVLSTLEQDSNIKIKCLESECERHDYTRLELGSIPGVPKDVKFDGLVEPKKWSRGAKKSSF